ncbi:efflux RND transporter periplasmic adaptor subunit [Aliiglaciecola sp. M165]|uniref:efflux RND transporter periplasmic adaptor subunit n=1 Tax=Aliiglaciecola sp. M165 TaxID=2593649 RepID=UPI00117BFE53|nr:efflux RND transporter periplasmic adaptor subunit [Aliiglaciecola sp. M165]TRY31724.1 efflux RND transporter periplasmic adaptor subunit [Aliiglaciecola sp. M165]
MKNHLTQSSLLVVFTSFLCVSSALAQQSRGGNRPANVIVEPVKIDIQQTVVEAVGTAEAINSLAIFPAAADKVVAVNFVPGQWVEKGSVLIELDARRQVVALQRAQIQLKDATRNLERLEQSRDKGAVTQSALDDAKTAKELAKVDVLDAQADLQDRQVIAPFSGTVGLTEIEVGDRITQQTLITTLDDRSQLYINFRAPESSVAMLSNDSQVTLQPWTNRGKSLVAKIAQLDSRISTDDRTLRIRAILDNTADEYRPGMSFRVNLTVAGQAFPMVPESGLSWGASGAFVWKVVDNKAVKVPVQIKQRLRGYLLVEGDLSDNDTLITEGIQRLRPGQEVNSQTALAQLP